jgi:DNA-binding NtrC family response regulator
MQPISVVLAQRDPGLTENLMRSIQNEFLNVATVTSTEEVRRAIARTRASLAIVDLELVNFPELGELCSEFPATAVICTHRLADEAMWSQSLAAGAVDCCFASDVLRILQTPERYVAREVSRAAPAA